VAATFAEGGGAIGATIGTVLEPGTGTAIGAESGAGWGEIIGFVVAAISGKPTSPNQMNNQVRNGRAPSSVDRVDLGNPSDPGDEDPHIHFKKEKQALKQDGTWKEGTGRQLTKAEAEWVKKNNWNLPKQNTQ
jgi:hypothetical protein